MICFKRMLLLSALLAYSYGHLFAMEKDEKKTQNVVILLDKNDEFNESNTTTPSFTSLFFSALNNEIPIIVSSTLVKALENTYQNRKNICSDFGCGCVLQKDSAYQKLYEYSFWLTPRTTEYVVLIPNNSSHYLDLSKLEKIDTFKTLLTKLEKIKDSEININTLCTVLGNNQEIKKNVIIGYHGFFSIELNDISLKELDNDKFNKSKSWECLKAQELEQFVMHFMQNGGQSLLIESCYASGFNAIRLRNKLNHYYSAKKSPFTLIVKSLPDVKSWASDIKSVNLKSYFLDIEEIFANTDVKSSSDFKKALVHICPKSTDNDKDTDNTPLILHAGKNQKFHMVNIYDHVLPITIEQANEKEISKEIEIKPKHTHVLLQSSFITLPLNSWYSYGSPIFLSLVPGKAFHIFKELKSGHKDILKDFLALKCFNIECAAPKLFFFKKIKYHLNEWLEKTDNDSEYHNVMVKIYSPNHKTIPVKNITTLGKKICHWASNKFIRSFNYQCPFTFVDIIYKKPNETSYSKISWVFMTNLNDARIDTDSQKAFFHSEETISECLAQEEIIQSLHDFTPLPIALEQIEGSETFEEVEQGLKKWIKKTFPEAKQKNVTKKTGCFGNCTIL